MSKDEQFFQQKNYVCVLLQVLTEAAIKWCFEK